MPWNIEWSYRQKSRYLAFIPIFLTSLFFSTFTQYCFHIHAYHISLGFFFFYMLCLILCCFILLLPVLIRTSFSTIYTGSWFHYYTNVYSKSEFDHANQEAHSMKTNTSLVNLMPHYDTRRQCVFATISAT